MKKILIGYGMSILSVGCLMVTVYGLAVLCMRGIVLAIIPAVIALAFSVLLAWVIGDMCCSYGEDDEE